jgi:hypothetical protein
MGYFTRTRTLSVKMQLEGLPVEGETSSRANPCNPVRRSLRGDPLIKGHTVIGVKFVNELANLASRVLRQTLLCVLE